MKVDPARRQVAAALVATAQRFHFVGIGGVGMSALARLLRHAGKTVTGTDKQASERLEQLRREGIGAQVGHQAVAVAGADCVVYTTAIAEDNPELQEARRRGLPILHRAELLAALMATRRGLAITGTHGKSTTTAMVGWILQEAGLDPLVVVGGDVGAWGGNLRLGDGEWAVYEACESDGTLLLYAPQGEIVTSLEPDHLDQYKTFTALQETVALFATAAPEEGFVVFNADSEVVRSVVSGSRARRVGYGERPGEWVVGKVEAMGVGGLRFELQWAGGVLPVRLRLFGKHNALNATAAIAAAAQVGVAPAHAAQALAAFAGVRRRFEMLGKMGSSVIIDDYAHHPTEIRATLQAAREHLRRPILAIFQPHLYSRTRDLMPEFARAFDAADEVIITEIYPAREEPLPGITGEALARQVQRQRGQRPTRFLATFEEIEAAVAPRYRDGWAILVIGAGDIRKVGERLAAEG
jgi:UDP-N-acetylmuramate--alanine ligase